MSKGSIRKVGTSHNWLIENFSSIQAATGAAVYSPTFSTTHPGGKTLLWRLQLYPKGHRADAADYLSVFLQNVGAVEVSTKFSVSAVVDSDIVIFKRQTLAPKLMSQDSRWGWTDYQKRVFFTDERICSLTNDTLELSCCVYSAIVAAKQFDEDESAKVLDHFERLMESGDLSDVTFLIGDKSLKLHKAILGSLSPVFHSTFNGERASNVRQVKMKDIGYEVAKEMFRYIYARRVNDIERIAGELYEAASKYQIARLMVLCEETLCGDLNVENALSRLELSVKYDLERLKDAATEFVASRLKDFLGKEQFKRLPATCKDLILSIVGERPDQEL